MTDIKLRDDVPAVFHSEAEQLTHEGKFFHVNHWSLSQSTANTILLVFKTPPTDHVHLWLEWASLKGGHLTINEGVTYTHSATGQTTLNIICDRRESPQTSGMLDKTAQTTWNAGGVMAYQAQSLVNTAEIYRDYIFSDWSASMKHEDFLILAKSTLYSIVLTTDVKESKSYLRVKWFEERIDKDI